MTQWRLPKRMHRLTEDSQDYVSSLITQLLSKLRAELRVGLSAGWTFLTLESPEMHMQVRMPTEDVGRLEFVLVDLYNAAVEEVKKSPRQNKPSSDGTEPFPPSIWEG